MPAPLQAIPFSDPPRRCAACGMEVGDSFTASSKDHMSDPGPVWCDRCLSHQAQSEIQQPPGERNPTHEQSIFTV